MESNCTWCGKEIAPDQVRVSTLEAITHGVCNECLRKSFSKMGEELSSFIDSLTAPVVVVDDTGTVQTVNVRAQTLLLKTLPEVEGYSGGEVFECAYATLPEGCGNTVHCSGCTIRRAVMETARSGKSLLKTPAYLNQGTLDSYQCTDFLISTEKITGLVLLRIDRVSTGDQPEQ